MRSFQEFERFYFRVEAVLDKYPILVVAGVGFIILLWLLQRRAKREE